MKRLLLLPAVLALFLSVNLAADEGHHHDYDPNEKLGKVSFPVSCAPDSARGMERGVALLHSFWYEEAEKQFQGVAAQEPQCAMAYWGEAMSLFHQLWERESPADLKRGWSLVEKAQSAGAKTGREKGYIAAMAALYREPEKGDYERRVSDYSGAMKKVYEENPQDHEAAAFYALSLLAASPEGDTAFVGRKQAIAILQRLFDEEPEHPGVAHYLIHACDKPQLADEGLAAARKYAAIAPTSAHAVHMPSHIFARLGLWQEDIRSNLASVEATKKSTAMHMGGAGHALHAMDFLEYAYLQIGDDAKAKAIVDELETMSFGDKDDIMAKRYVGYARAEFAATYLLETRQWKAALELKPPQEAPYDRAITYRAQAIAAGHLRDAAAAKAAADQVRAMVEETRKSPEAYVAEQMGTDVDEAAAWADFAAGRNDEAVKRLRAVADKQDAMGKAEVELPAREMLGDMLLEMKRPEAALAEYEKSLKTDPNRFNGLYGAGQAAEMSHEPQKANAYYAQLLKNCVGDSGRPELARIKTVMAEK